VIIVGAGNTALMAALSAHENGAKVLLLEKAPKASRGGNAYFTSGAFRAVYKGMEEVKEFMDLTEAEMQTCVVEESSADDWYSDIMRISEGRADPELAELVIEESNKTVRWMFKQGARWELRTITAVRDGDKLRWRRGSGVLQSKGGGAGLSDTLFDLVEKKGIDLLYETKAVKLLTDSRSRVYGATIKGKEELQDIKSKAVILACGGFQANPEWRARYLGKNWDFIKVRGSRYDTGDGLKMALEIGAQPAGNWSGCNATVIDADSPDIADRAMTDQTARFSYPYSIMVNVDGKRFLDEGEDTYGLTYAKVGHPVHQQPHFVAFQIFDTKCEPLLDDRYHTGASTTANSIEELADKLGIEPELLVETVKKFNSSIQEGQFNPLIKDGKHTVGLAPNKSNWSQKIDTPPFTAYAVVAGVSFTFGGLKINRNTQVLNTEGGAIPGLYAAGDIVGGLYYFNYPGGTGLMAGAAFGRLVGAYAAAQ